jgi:long-subunit fatty acid transport protein
MLTSTKLDGNGTGFGANFGLMFKPTETIRIGASVEWYGDVTLDGTVDATTYFANNPTANAVVQAGLKPTFTTMLQAGLLTPTQYGVLTNYYSGASLPQETGLKVKADLPLPMKAGIGIAYTGISNLLLTGDVAFTQWSSWDVIKINDKETGAGVSQLIEQWKDGVRFGVGAEYSLSLLKLRASFYTEPAAAVEETMNPSIPDISRRNVVMIGAYHEFGPLGFHVSYEKMFIGDLNIKTWVPYSDNSGYQNMAGVYTMDCNNVMFGLDYNF